MFIYTKQEHTMAYDKPSKLMKMIANLAAAPCPSRKGRTAIRRKIMRVEQRNAAMQAAQQQALLRQYQDLKAQWRTQSDCDKIIPARYDEYDLVFAIGSACPTTWILSNFGLRTFSNPFDWSAGHTPRSFYELPNTWRDTRFIEKVTALCNDFENFFNYEDLTLWCSHSVCDTAQEHQKILNTRTNIHYMHIFPMNESWERYFPIAHEKIMQRGRKLISQIDQSRRVLIVWAHRITEHNNVLDAPVDDDNIRRAVEMLEHRWPNCEFDIVFFEHDGTLQKFKFEKVNVCGGAYRVRSNHFDWGYEYNNVHPIPNKMHTPPLVMGEMLDNIRLRDNVSFDASGL